MADEGIRIGLIGAGRNTRDRHIPGFHGVDRVEIVAVANRSRESGRVVADQFNIPTVYDSWQELLEDESINAVCIGTWPYMHRTLTIAALEAGKHVLTEARMAANAAEAREMLAASRAHPGLVTQIVPSPLTFKVDNLLTQKIAEGYIGDVLAVSLQSLTPGVRRYRRADALAERPRPQRIQHPEHGHLVRGDDPVGRPGHAGYGQHQRQREAAARRGRAAGAGNDP